MSEERETTHSVAPWGSVSALVAACVVTLVGAARGIDPDVILLRAVAAAFVVGAVVAVTSCVVRLFVRSS